MKLGTNKETPFGSTTTSRSILVFLFYIYIYKEVMSQSLAKLFHSLSMKYLENP